MYYIFGYMRYKYNNFSPSVSNSHAFGDGSEFGPGFGSVWILSVC